MHQNINDKSHTIEAVWLYSAPWMVASGFFAQLNDQTVYFFAVDSESRFVQSWKWVITQTEA